MIGKFPVQWRQNPQQAAFREALTRAYTTWAAHHREWVDYSFNEFFLTHQVAPRLERAPQPDPAELAHLWAEQFTWFNEEMRQRHISNLIPAIANFLCCFEVEVWMQNFASDEDSGTVLCLCDVPSKEAVEAVHQEAYGGVADQIVKVREGH
jgi:hypothetical protein